MNIRQMVKNQTQTHRLKSGKTAKITSRIHHPQIWPHSELSLLHVSKYISYDDLTIEEFTAGYCAILRSLLVSAAEIDARISHLQDLMYLAIQHEWSSVRDFHTVVLLEIEQGHLHWGNSFAHLERHSLRLQPRSGITQRSASTLSSAVLFCQDFQRSNCKHTKDHYSTIRGEQKWLQHVCAKCWISNRHVARRTEFLPDCPLSSGSPELKQPTSSTS